MILLQADDPESVGPISFHPMNHSELRFSGSFCSSVEEAAAAPAVFRLLCYRPVVSHRSSSVFSFTLLSAALKTKRNKTRSQLISLFAQGGGHETCCLHFYGVSVSPSRPRPPAPHSVFQDLLFFFIIIIAY